MCHKHLEAMIIPRVWPEQKPVFAKSGVKCPMAARLADKFWAPPPPDGWDYQWKRRSVYNQEDPAYQVELARQGWEAVPLSRHSEMMPRGWSGQTIEVEGMTLMERPADLHQGSADARGSRGA